MAARILDGELGVHVLRWFGNFLGRFFGNLDIENDVRDDWTGWSKFEQLVLFFSDEIGCLRGA